MTKAHARLSPSGCDRWSTCTASVALIERLRGTGAIPPRSSSVFAAEGTVAHSIREMCFEFGLDAHNFVGSVMSADGYTFTVDENMTAHVQRGVDFVRERNDSPFVEVEVDLSPWLPGQFGTCDTFWIEVIEGLVTLVVKDFKYGQGEPVDAKGNKQMRNYALGAWNSLGRPKIDRVLMIIDQPRAGGFKEWEISFDELMAFGEELKAIYAKIVGGDVEFAPGSKACRWCEVKDTEGGCAARNKWLLEMAVADPDDLAGDEPKFLDGEFLTPERRWHIVKHAPELRAWLAKLHEDSLRAAVNGKPDPGSKAIQGDQGDRYFKDKAKAEALLVGVLGDAAYKPRDLIGFTEIDKLVKPGKKKQGHPKTWDALQELVDRPIGKPKLVPEDHPKPAYAAWEDDFDDLE